MARYVVWINGLPLLLGKGVKPTEENVNAARRNTGLPPLNRGQYPDIVNGVSIVDMVQPVIGGLELSYPE